jgi:hypothetical protein
MMIRSFGPLILLVLCGITARAEDEAKAAVKKGAQELVQSLIKGDYSRMVDLTYPKFVELKGGRDKMIDALRASLKEASDQDVTIGSFAVGEPSDLLTEGKNTFVVLPTSGEINVPSEKLVVKSYLLGISPDGAKSWTFLAGSDLDDRTTREKVLPKLPAKLELPEKQKPERINKK